MKRNFLLISVLTAISAISGYLMSQMSFVGRLGINLVHKEYKFLKVWWQGGATILGIFLAIFLLHYLLHRKLPIGIARALHILFFLVAVGGVYFTYSDFEDDFTHSILHQRFHIGVYLFWFGWMFMCLDFLFRGKTAKAVTDSDSKDPAAQ